MILIMGQSGAGKTTFSEQFDNVRHLDDYPFPRFINCNQAAGPHEVIEGIYNLRCRRIKLLETVHAPFNICIWIKTPDHICEERNTKLNRLNRLGPLEPPSYDEGWDLILEVQND